MSTASIENGIDDAVDIRQIKHELLRWQQGSANNGGDWYGTDGHEPDEDGEDKQVEHEQSFWLFERGDADGLSLSFRLNTTVWLLRGRAFGDDCMGMSRAS